MITDGRKSSGARCVIATSASMRAGLDFDRRTLNVRTVGSYVRRAVTRRVVTWRKWGWYDNAN